jgi:hypothetical protein
MWVKTNSERPGHVPSPRESLARVELERRSLMSAWQSVGQQVGEAMATWPEVEAVALGGSHAAGTGDDASDIDLYVYGDVPPPLRERE